MRKKIHQNTILGEQGIALIHQAVLAMGFVWYPTGQVEAGIDGVIEIRDPVTGEMTNCIVQVQSKATKGAFLAETTEGLDFLCEERDVDYWMSGNAPVIVVLSRPSTNEAYWVSVKGTFQDPGRRKSRRLHFRKDTDRFDAGAAERLRNLAVSRDSGIYFAPPPKLEVLTTNLLPVTGLSSSLHHAAASFATREELQAELLRQGARDAWEWALHGGFVLSFRELGEPPWSRLCDLGTYEVFDTTDWSLSDDSVRRRVFVELLNQCLRRMLSRAGVTFWRKYNRYYYRATRKRGDKVIHYEGTAKRTSRTVFAAYRKRRKPEEVAFYRHSAFEGRFVRYDGRWYLEVLPTYVFTVDGEHPSRFGPELLQKIKLIERNEAVRGQLKMWESVLTAPPTLFEKAYPFLSLGKLITVEAEVGIDDAGWLQREEVEWASEGADDHPSLFE